MENQHAYTGDFLTWGGGIPEDHYYLAGDFTEWDNPTARNLLVRELDSWLHHPPLGIRRTPVPFWPGESLTLALTCEQCTGARPIASLRWEIGDGHETPWRTFLPNVWVAGGDRCPIRTNAHPEYQFLAQDGRTLLHQVGDDEWDTFIPVFWFDTASLRNAAEAASLHGKYRFTCPSCLFRAPDSKPQVFEGVALKLAEAGIKSVTLQALARRLS